MCISVILFTRNVKMTIRVENRTMYTFLAWYNSLFTSRGHFHPKNSIEFRALIQYKDVILPV